MSSEVDQADLRVRSWRRRLRGNLPVLCVVAAGGGLGALGRYGLAHAFPARPGQFPWATFATNVLGCLLIGVLMVLVVEVGGVHRLVRPFLGVGVLGGFTTFSTYAEETRALIAPDTVAVAFGYLAGTLIAAMLAVIAGAWATRALTGASRRPDRVVA